MTVEVLYFDGCPGYEPLADRVRALLGHVGLDEPVRLRRVASEEEAERSRFLGSPTLRVDGVDVDPTAAGRDDFGLKCRLYRVEERTAPLPPDEWILAALSRAE